MEETTNARYQIGVDINSNKCEKEKKPAKEKIQIGTMRCLRPDNEVTDIEVASTTSQGSKLSDIMKCMFFRKKETEVVEMKPDKSPAPQKQSLTLDRSERSRRVLKMESMRAAPLERKAQPPDKPTTPPASKRFLPSENPTAAFLAYVNPQNKQIRRAYSEAIKSSNPPPNDKPLHAREAFVQKHESMRNTNYRANAAMLSDNNKKQTNDNEFEENNQNARINKNDKNSGNVNMTIVPGTSMSVEEEVKYQKHLITDDIHDLHDEIRRMKSQRENGQPRRRKREGSISVSGSGSEFDSEGEEIERPMNPEPEPEADVRNYKGVKNRSVEEAIDGLYMQTQRKLDDIYQTGLGSIEGYRPESSIDEPDMTKFEKDLFSSDQPKDSGVETESGDNENGDTNISFVKDYKSADNKQKLHNTHFVSGSVITKSATQNVNVSNKSNVHMDKNAEEKHIDSLLNEVSAWAKDRENWLLGRTELDNKYTESKETIKLSHKVDFHNERRTMTDMSTGSDEIERVRASNEQRSNNWIDGKSNNPKCSQRTIDMITSPRLFSPRNSENNTTEMFNIITSPKVFSPRKSENNAAVKTDPIENSDDKIFSPRNGMTIPSQIKDSNKAVVPKEEQRASKPSKRTHKGVAVFDYSVNAENDKVHNFRNIETNKPVSILADKSNEHNKTMINGIFIPTPTFDTETEDDRSTIRDDLSDELDTKVPYRARSPDSWLSSCGSPTNFIKRPESEDNDFDDSLASVSSLTTDSVKVHRVAVANAPESANQIVRQNLQTHAPFRGLDKQGTPVPNDSEHLPLPKSMARNTQLQAIGSGSSFRQDRNTNPVQRLDSISGINSLTGLPSIVNSGVLKGTRNLNDFEINMNLNSRPFSEITLSSSEAVHTNNRLLGNSFKYQGGYNQVPTEVVDVRPASETFTAKRTDKVGMGQVMATDSTRERNRYAKEVVNNMERKLQQPPKAFSQKEVNTNQKVFSQVEVDTHQNTFPKIETKTAPKQKQNEVAFISQLLQGGYSYDKHSSRRLNSASGNGTRMDSAKGPNERDDSRGNVKKDSTQCTQPGLNLGANASVSASFKEASITMKAHKDKNKLAKSEGSFSSPRINGGYNYDYQTMSKTKGNGNAMLADVDIHPRNLDVSKTKTNSSANESHVPSNKPTENANKLNADADLSSNSQTNINSNNKTMEQISHGTVSTAAKFRKMRNKRNQEMMWLMKDAAETEV